MIQLEIKKALFSDLINNFEEFGNSFPKDELSKLNDWDDDSDYSNYQHIDDLLASIDEDNIDTSISHTVRVPSEYIFSSEKSKGGGDRPYDQNRKPAYVAKHKSNLDTLVDGGNRVKGFSSVDAKQLIGMFRYDNKSGMWQLSKYVGNGRFVMKHLVSKGQPTELLMSVRFHDKDTTESQMRECESECHSSDAGDLSSQNEPQKFISGLTARRTAQVFLFEFLKKHGLDYVKGDVSVMKHQGIKPPKDTTFIPLFSLSGLKDGEGNGFFKKYGTKNVEYAIDTIKECLKLTKEMEMPSFELNTSVIETISLSYKIYTNNGFKSGSPFFTPAELDNFWTTLFKESNNGLLITKKLLLNDLSKTGAVKDIPYILATIIWPALINYYVRLKQEEKLKKGDTSSVKPFGRNSYAVTKHLGMTKDRFLSKEMQSLIS